MNENFLRAEMKYNKKDQNKYNESLTKKQMLTYTWVYMVIGN